MQIIQITLPVELRELIDDHRDAAKSFFDLVVGDNDPAQNIADRALACAATVGNSAACFKVYVGGRIEAAYFIAVDADKAVQRLHCWVGELESLSTVVLGKAGWEQSGWRA